MRCFSTILFALMTLVLPMAGVQKYFCTMSMAFVEGAESCPVEQKDCCKKEQNHQPTKPKCFVSAKLLPNADETIPVHLPAEDAQWCMVLVSMADLQPVIVSANVFPEKEREPPDRTRLFLVQKRLLI